MPLGGTPSYLVQYNGYQLPGYCQSESFDSGSSIAQHRGTYVDGSLSEYTGLENKALTVNMKVWEDTFDDAKNAVELAATYLRSRRSGFANLYLQFSDRHYEAMVESITLENTAGKSRRLMDYNVKFECLPWLIEDAVTTITGTGTIDTDQVSRTFDEGGWSPTTITVTGTNVTISGYTAQESFTGYVSISGAVSGMVINSEDVTAEIASVNRNDLMLRSADYRLFVGPNKTTFVITGASSCTIAWHNRWFL